MALPKFKTVVNVLSCGLLNCCGIFKTGSSIYESIDDASAHGDTPTENILGEPVGGNRTSRSESGSGSDSESAEVQVGGEGIESTDSDALNPSKSPSYGPKLSASPGPSQ